MLVTELVVDVEVPGAPPAPPAEAVVVVPELVVETDVESEVDPEVEAGLPVDPEATVDPEVTVDVEVGVDASGPPAPPEVPPPSVLEQAPSAMAPAIVAAAKG